MARAAAPGSEQRSLPWHCRSKPSGRSDLKTAGDRRKDSDGGHTTHTSERLVGCRK
jgi:hypothetical protein